MRIKLGSQQFTAVDIKLYIVLLSICIISLAKVDQHLQLETLLVTYLECPPPGNTPGLKVPSVDWCLQVQANCSSSLIQVILLQDPTTALNTPLVQEVIYSGTLMPCIQQKQRFRSLTVNNHKRKNLCNHTLTMSLCEEVNTNAKSV
jgi:hypothetical protein